MLSKETKIRVLENFYALDNVFFGRPVSEITTCCPLVKEEYLSVKGALMSVYIEMMRLIDHQPAAIEEKVNSSTLKENAKISADFARENAQRIVTTEKARANLKEMLKEELKSNPKANVTRIVEKSIRMKSFGLAVDNLLVARSLNEAADVSALNEWHGQIIEDSYKVLRDSLVEAAYMIMYDEDDQPIQTENKKKVITNESEEVINEETLQEAPIKYRASQIKDMARKHGKLIEKQSRAGCEKWSITTPFKKQEYKNKMMACKAEAAIKGLKAESAMITKLSSHCNADDPMRRNDCKKQLHNRMVDIQDEIKDEMYYVKLKNKK